MWREGMARTEISLRTPAGKTERLIDRGGPTSRHSGHEEGFGFTRASAEEDTTLTSYERALPPLFYTSFADSSTA